MKLEIWQEIVAACQEADERIEGATPAAVAEDLEGAPAAVGVALLESLHGELRAVLAELARKLTSRVSRADLKQICFVLAIQFDERVQRRLTPAEEPQWPLLQRALFNIDHGGDVFYDMIEQRLNSVDTPPLLFELLYFCLSDGFVGRHNRSRRMIDDYKRKLAQRIGRGEVQVIDEATTFFQAPVTHFPVRYYATAALLILLWPVILMLAGR